MGDVAQVLSEVDRGLKESCERLFSFLRIPSVSTEQSYAPACRQAAQWLKTELDHLGFTSRLVETPGHPIVLGHRLNAVRHNPRLLFYGHYDVQPVDPLSLWRADPFDPRIEEIDARQVIVARGASDDKGQLLTFVEACRAWIRITGSLPSPVTMMIEGEEESGGEHFPAFLKDHKNDLAADLALICDTGMPNRTTPAITTSLRGLLAEEITITCASRDLHSGMFGNAARNAIDVLCRLLSELRDTQGRITLPNFYEGVREPPKALRNQWREHLLADAAFLSPIGLTHAAGESAYSAIEQIWARPSFDINGIVGGYVGEGFKTVLPSQASAKLSFRLVSGQNAKNIRETLHEWIESRLPPDAQVSFVSHGLSEGFEVESTHHHLSRALAALEDEWKSPGLAVGCGGSIPVVGELKSQLGLDSLLIGFGQDDDQIHAPNEQYGVESFHRGIRSWVRILAALSDAA